MSSGRREARPIAIEPPNDVPTTVAGPAAQALDQSGEVVLLVPARSPGVTLR